VVTELPVGMWNDKFKEWCEDMVEKKEMVGFKDRSTVDKVCFELVAFSASNSDDFEDKLEKELCSVLNTSNVVVFDSESKITKTTISEVFEMWGVERLKLYQKRKEDLLKRKAVEVEKCRQKIEFISMVKSGALKLTDDEDVVVEKMQKSGLDLDLLNLSVRGLNEKKRLELVEALKHMKDELEVLRGTSEREMWLSEVQRVCSCLGLGKA
jgi:DNA topoisomerase-2